MVSKNGCIIWVATEPSPKRGLKGNPMRKETKTQTHKAVQSSVATGYHAGSYSTDVNYAFLGFTENLYFTSDRTKKLDANFKLEDGSPLKGYGLEIELESSKICDDNALAFTLKHLAFQQLPQNLFKFQHDGSLGGQSSTEAITQVMTKEFVRNNYGGFKYMFEIFKVFGVSATRTGNCGMHCNMSVGLFGKDAAKQKEAIMKFIYFINSNYRLSCDLVKRKAERTGFCAQMSQFANKEYCKAFDLSSTSEFQSNHHVCFNYAHFNTGRIELRLVGGQADYFAFRNTMEVIFQLVDAVKRLSWKDMDNLEKVFEGCNKYVMKRLMDCVANNTMSQAQYDAILAKSDTETDFGNC